MSTRAITLTLVIVALLTFWVVADAKASTCRSVDKVWTLEEGSLDTGTAKVDVTGVLCSEADGWFNTGQTSLNMEIRTTAAGKVAGFVYWKRGGTVKTEDTRYSQTWRTYFAVKVCMVRVADWVCGPTARFAVNVRWIDTATQAPIQYRRWVGSRNAYAGGVHFA